MRDEDEKCKVNRECTSKHCVSGKCKYLDDGAGCEDGDECKPTSYCSSTTRKCKGISKGGEQCVIEELKTNLYHLFSEFGDVIEINVRKSKKMKGQAFGVFKDIPSATKAKLSLNGSLFFGKQLHIDFANSVSDIILKITNSLNAKEKVKNNLERKRKREEEYNNV